MSVTEPMNAEAPQATTQPFDELPNIVPIFAGGGTRLPAHVGVLQALETMQVDFSTIVGVSGGSIIAALYAFGKTVPEMRELAAETDFRQFKEYSIWRLLHQGGLSSGERFERWMDEQLNGMTFADSPMDLHILATDVNGGGPVIFNRENSPEMPVAKAVHYSMAIPLLFSYQIYKGHLLVDGAILSEDALFQDWQGDGTQNVCFRLKSDTDAPPSTPKKHYFLPEYVGMVIRTFMNALSREYVHADHWHNTLVINTGGASAVDFAMTPDDKNKLFERGFETTIEFLPKKLHNTENSQHH